MTDQALLAGAHDTAHLEGHGAIPAGPARELVADHLDAGSKVWLRRLYADPRRALLAQEPRVDPRRTIRHESAKSRRSPVSTARAQAAP